MELTNKEMQGMLDAVSLCQETVNSICKGAIVRLEIPTNSTKQDDILVKSRRMIEDACLYMEIDVKDIYSGSRKEEYREIKWSMAEIIKDRYGKDAGPTLLGKIFNVDHATIIHWQKNFEKLYGFRRKYTEKHDMLTRHIKKLYPQIHKPAT